MHASYGSFKDLEQEQSFSDRLLTWYTMVKRDLPWRRTGDPYSIWVSEVMLQQTQVKTVIPYYERFIERFPGVEQLGTASLDEVLTIWSGLGYYSRGRRMWEGANYLLKQWDGKMPGNYEALLLIPGIGDYTAGAIASIAFGQRVTAIDGNVKRVLSRLLAWQEPVETVHSYRHFKEQLLIWQPALQPGDFNQALMELGAMVCTPKKPDCERCPLVKTCKGYLQGDFLRYPVKKPKAQRQEVTRLTFVLRRGDQVYLQKRPSKGLLADLWEFPGVELSHDHLHNLEEGPPPLDRKDYVGLFQQSVFERSFDGLVRDQFEQDKGISLEGPIWYTFSHRRWKIIWAIIELPDCPDSYEFLMKESEGVYGANSREIDSFEESRCWVSINDLGAIPLPVAFTAIVENLTPKTRKD